MGGVHSAMVVERLIDFLQPILNTPVCIRTSFYLMRVVYRTYNVEFETSTADNIFFIPCSFSHIL